MERARYGMRRACVICDQDIEFHGSKAGWIDRGGNRACTKIEIKPWEFIGPPKGAKHRPA